MAGVDRRLAPLYTSNSRMCTALAQDQATAVGLAAPLSASRDLEPAPSTVGHKRLGGLPAKCRYQLWPYTPMGRPAQVLWNQQVCISGVSLKRSSAACPVTTEMKQKKQTVKWSRMVPARSCCSSPCRNGNGTSKWLMNGNRARS